MQHSSLSWPNSKNKYYNPITKIQSLIHSLDAELVHLCQQYRVPKLNAYQANQTGRHQKNATRSSSGSKLQRSNMSGVVIPQAGMDVPIQSSVATGVATRHLAGIYRARVIDAYRSRRIFTVHGNYHTIRRQLLRRGWLEKLGPGRYPKLQGLPEDVLLQHARRGNDYEAVAISKIINHFPAFFIWQPKGMRDMYSDSLPYRNRVRRGRNLDFSTKVGLIGCAEQAQWYRQNGVFGMSHPRFYRLGGSYEERMAFMEDFRATQCRSLIRFLKENIGVPDMLFDEEKGTVELSIVEFAVEYVRQLLADWEHSAIDEPEPSVPVHDQLEWKSFIMYSTQIVTKKAKFKASLMDLPDFVNTATNLLIRCEEKRPDYAWDGCRNLWILKPGYQCRGIGIIIRNSLDELLQWASSNPNRRYIAQKYVERPLLIYKTKFDIRQYMLLTISESTVSVWLYRDCYLRFSSQEFSIDDLREVIHLTNNSVQKKYKMRTNRDSRLPKNNMWSLEQFKVYLRYKGVPEEMWNNKIYTGFKENLTAVVMASLEETDFTENAFELYGCDFMLDEQYNPILIEVNSTPDLTPSTDVTARICPMVLKDLVKVIVDLPRNSRTSTGLFEHVYEVNYRVKREELENNGLDISGKAVTLFKPITLPSRQKFLKRSLKIIRNAETTIKKLKRVAPKPPVDNDVLKTVGQPLRSFDKEALAVHYTTPK